MIWDSSAFRRGKEGLTARNWSGKKCPTTSFSFCCFTVYRKVWNGNEPPWGRNFRRDCAGCLCSCPLVCRGAGPLWRLGERGKPLTARQLVLPSTLTAPALSPLLALRTQHHHTLQRMAKMCLTFCFGLKLILISLNCFESRPSAWVWLPASGPIASAECVQPCRGLCSFPRTPA